MSGNLQNLMCQFMEKKSDPLKGCLIAALKSKEHYLSLLDESLGSTIPSEDIRLCELLTDVALFREEIKLTRDGRNRYKLFYLTEKGTQLAEQIEQEGFDGAIPESIPVI